MPEEKTLSVSRENLPGSQVALTIEVPAEQVDSAFQSVLGRLAQRLKIQGFRPGKAPANIVEARVGPEALREEVGDALAQVVVPAAIRQEALETIDRPQVDIQALERGAPGRFIAVVTVMPDVTLPDLASIHVTPEITEVRDEMIEARIRELLDSRTEVTPVERSVEEGDVVVADLKVSVDGEDVPSAARTAGEFEVLEGELIPEVRTALPGHAVGEVVEVDVQMPDDHRDPQLAGKLAHLAFTIVGVKEKKYPAMTDDLVSTLTDGAQSTVLAFRANVRSEIETRARERDEAALEQALLRQTVEQATVEIPASLVDHEVAHEQEDMERRLQQQGIKFERYLQYLGSSLGEWSMKARPEAEGRLRVELVMSELARQAGIDPTAAEVEEFTRTEAAMDPQLKDRIDEVVRTATALDFFRRRLIRRRTLRHLVEQCSTVTPGTT